MRWATTLSAVALVTMLGGATASEPPSFREVLCTNVTLCDERGCNAAAPDYAVSFDWPSATAVLHFADRQIDLVHTEAAPNYSFLSFRTPPRGDTTPSVSVFVISTGRSIEASVEFLAESETFFADCTPS